MLRLTAVALAIATLAICSVALRHQDAEKLDCMHLSITLEQGNPGGGCQAKLHTKRFPINVTIASIELETISQPYQCDISPWNQASVNDVVIQPAPHNSSYIGMWVKSVTTSGSTNFCQNAKLPTLVPIGTSDSPGQSTSIAQCSTGQMSGVTVSVIASGYTACKPLPTFPPKRLR